VPPRTALSDAYSKDLKERGFSFVGSTIVYAHMQATGMVNDHVIDCFRRPEVERLGRTSPPKGRERSAQPRANAAKPTKRSTKGKK